MHPQSSIPQAVEWPIVRSSDHELAHSALRMKGQLGSWLGLRGPEVIPQGRCSH